MRKSALFIRVNSAYLAGMKRWLLPFGCLTLLLAGGIVLAQNETTPAIHLLGLNDAEFPHVDAYASVVDPARSVPVTSLTFTNFSAVASNGQSLQVQSVREERRPLRVVAIVDLTSSVSLEELFYEKLAVTKLAEGLGEADEIGLVTLGPRSAVVASPLQSEHQPVLTALENLETNPDLGGNVYWDAIYGALVLHDENPSDVRQVVVLITDVVTGSADGDRTEDDVLSLAQEKGVEIFALYFAYEGEDIPADGPEIPEEILAITEATGGAAFATAAQFDGDSYTDEQALPVMAESVNLLIEHEYHLELNALFPSDGQTYALSVSVLVQGRLPGPPSTLPFIAGAGSPTPPPADETAVSATPENGAATEVAETVGTGGSLHWIDVPPSSIAPNSELMLRTRIDEISGIEYVSLLVNNVEVEKHQTPPFGEVSFAWTPQEEGEFSLSVVAGGSGGVTVAPLIATISVAPPGGNSLLFLVGSVVAGMVMAAGVIRWRLSRRGPVEAVVVGEGASPQAQEATKMALRANAALETLDGYRWSLVQGENTLGRHSSNSIQIMDESISRHHAIVEVDGMLCFYVDREASHPSEINGVLLTPDARHELRFGDTIRVGSTILKFVKYDH